MYIHTGICSTFSNMKIIITQQRKLRRSICLVEDQKEKFSSNKCQIKNELCTMKVCNWQFGKIDTKGISSIWISYFPCLDKAGTCCNHNRNKHFKMKINNNKKEKAKPNSKMQCKINKIYTSIKSKSYSYVTWCIFFEKQTQRCFKRNWLKGD